MTNKIENITTVIEYIESNLNEKLDLTTIADSVGYSKYHLHRMFTDTVGLSMHDYIQRRQITEAAKLLLFSNKSILEIALIAGYESQQSFSKVFKQLYKKTPNQYRTYKEFYALQLKFVLKKELSNILSSEEIQEQIVFADELDITSLIDLIHLSIDGFPNLVEEEYINALKICIKEKRVLILKHNNIIIAAMAFQYDTGSIESFAVHPLYRNHDITKIFLDKLMNDILKNNEISITTYREGDKADTGYRKAYKELGFAEAELLIEFGYPTQKFVLTLDGGKDND